MSRSAARAILLTLVLALAAAICGQAFYHLWQQASAKMDLSRQASLSQELSGQKQREKQLLRQQEELRLRRQEVWQQSLREGEEVRKETAAQVQAQELMDIQNLACFLAVEGPGLKISLNDKKGYDPQRDSLFSLIHDSNLKLLIRLLVNNGAEALSINGQRYAHNSSISCVGSTILMNQERLIPPFVLEVIGPAAAMAEAVRNDELLKRLTAAPYYIQLSIEEQSCHLQAFHPRQGLDGLSNQLEPVYEP